MPEAEFRTFSCYAFNLIMKTLRQHYRWKERELNIPKHGMRTRNQDGKEQHMKKFKKSVVITGERTVIIH